MVAIRFERALSASGPLKPAVSLLGLCVCATIVVAPLRWQTVVSLGDVSLEPIHVTLILVGLCFAFSARSIAGAWSLLLYAASFWLFSILYLALSLVFLLGHGFSEAVVNLLPQGLYIPAFFLVYYCLTKAIVAGSTAIYYWSAALAIVVFLLMLTVSAAIGGADFIGAWSALLTTRNFYAFNRTFKAVIFDSSGLAGSPDQLVAYSTAIANELASCVVVLFALMMSLRYWTPRFWGQLGEAACFAITTFIVIVSFSRSAFLTFVLVLGTSFLLSVTKGLMSAVRAVLTAMGVTIASVILVAASDLGSVMMDNLSDTTSYEGRLHQFDRALELIEADPWSGTGREIKIGDHDIHNLFLATWAKTGFLPFLFILLAYGVLLYSWLATFARTVVNRNFWCLPHHPGWVIAIAIVPLLRVFLSGKGGTFSVSMWLGTAAFLAFIIANQITRAKLAQARSLRE